MAEERKFEYLLRYKLDHGGSNGFQLYTTQFSCPEGQLQTTTDRHIKELFKTYGNKLSLPSIEIWKQIDCYIEGPAFHLRR